MQIGEGAELAFEPELRGRSRLLQDLERDAQRSVPVVRLEHPARPALADQTDQLIAPALDQ